MTRTAVLCIALIVAVLNSYALGEDGGGGGEGAGTTVTFPPKVNKSCPIPLKSASSSHEGVQAVIEKNQTALLLLVGFGGLSLLLALLHNALRAHVFHDQHSLDTAFDAGGDVSLSLTAVTVASQIFLPTDILHSTTLTVKNGMAGPFWYSMAVLVNTFIFPIVSVRFKSKAPGAKTYLQIIRARFGKRCHLVMCFFALMVNVINGIDILLAGQAAIQSLTKDASDEFCLLLMVILFGSYSLVGGLGTTFYVSYFNACLVYVLLLVFIVKVLHSDSDQWQEIGSTARMYEAISCLKEPGNNAQNSYLTFRSPRACIQGVFMIFVTTVMCYCDQASWQSRIAAKPAQGVGGFLLAAMMWFSIPNLMALTSGMTYLALSSSNNATHLLTMSDINQGLVTPMIAERVLGATGGFLVLTMVSMAVMSTGSGEVLAISSIIVYDICQPYIRPFRKGLTTVQCVLCGKMQKELAKLDSAVSGEGVCRCVPAHQCQGCHRDLRASHAKPDPSDQKPYSCPTHGAFRRYMDGLLRFKSWCLILVSLAAIPLGMVVNQTGIDLNWMFFTGVTLILPGFPPTLLSIIWVKATSLGVIVGSIAGLVASIITGLITAATLFEGGLNNFLVNTVQDYTILAATTCGLAVSTGSCVIISLLTHRIHSEEDAEREWMKVYCIDNPLQPWTSHYQEELKGYTFEERPSMAQLRAVFRPATLTAYIAGACCLAVFAGVLPALLYSVPVLEYSHFNAWLVFNQGFAVLMACVVILAPPAEEVVRVVRQFRKNRQLKAYKISDPLVTDLVCKENGGDGGGDGDDGAEGMADKDV